MKLRGVVYRRAWSAQELQRGYPVVKHAEIRWNPELQEWFCVRCGLTSDHITKENAETEMEFFDCSLPIPKPPDGTTE